MSEEINDNQKCENEEIKETEKQMTKGTRLVCDLLDWVETFAMALCVVVLLFTFVFRVVTVDGQSMEQTLHHGERLIISDMFYTPKNGDIVITAVPEYYGNDPLVKRVIAVGGQTIDIDFDSWIVRVDGEPVQQNEQGLAVVESYVNFIDAVPMIRESLSISYPYTIPEGYVFIMGDNRNNSRDSRYFGVVDQRNIIGKVYFRIFPFSKFGKVE